MGPPAMPSKDFQNSAWKSAGKAAKERGGQLPKMRWSCVLFVLHELHFQMPFDLPQSWARNTSTGLLHLLHTGCRGDLWRNQSCRHRL